VIRERRTGVILFVTAPAIDRKSGIPPARVAIRARRSGMLTLKWKPRPGVIERGRAPLARRMAGRTIVIEFPRPVIRLPDPVVIIHMARVAILWRPGVSGGVTVGAFQRLVRRRLHEGRKRMGETPGPTQRGHGMARRAIPVESALAVIGLRCLFIIVAVAGVTIARGIYELVLIMVDVALETIDQLVRAEKGKPRQLVPCNLLCRRAPAVRGVTIPALVAELSLVMIGVTEGAIRFQVTESNVRMASLARDGTVFAIQNVIRQLVIKRNALLELGP